MVQLRIIEFATPEYDLSVRLRYDILRVPLGLNFSVDDFENEYQEIHMGVFDERNRLLACLVLKEINVDTVKMRQVAVLELAQRKGIGSALVRFSETYAIRQGYKKMVLNARDVSLSFYKSLQYEKVGKPFVEVGIKHYKMEKSL